ncbi:MAG: UDP-N-acetylmuramate dehydrogenase [Candidatus Sumerlaeaceae bacterium]|nr:UDP-N-acetylmuramate dehydrogenase [Candidatus Sumerlaeaceae bacterium]
MTTIAPPHLTIQENVPLAPLTTLGIGGPARYYVSVCSVADLVDALDWAGRNDLPVFVLGGGSNVVVADAGFSGLVVRLRLTGIRWDRDGDTALATVGAGIQWDHFVEDTVSRNLAGIECLSGIPGHVGATPIQNVGAYGQEVSQTIERVTALDRQTGQVAHLPASSCRFGYRSSRFKGPGGDRYIITSVVFRLRYGGPPTLKYGDVTRYFEQAGQPAPSLQDVRRAILEIRAAKGMVYNSSDSETHSCGSFFVNPVVPRHQFEAAIERGLEQGFILPDDRVPHYEAEGGRVKMSAAWLIERAGFERGLKLGSVGLSQRHVLALVNRGGGTAKDIVELMRVIQARVRDTFDIELQPEPVFIGFGPGEGLSASDG